MACLVKNPRPCGVNKNLAVLSKLPMALPRYSLGVLPKTAPPTVFIKPLPIFIIDSILLPNLLSPNPNESYVPHLSPISLITNGWSNPNTLLLR